MYRKKIKVTSSLIAHVHRYVKEVSKIMNIKEPNKVYLFKHDFIKFTDNKLTYEQYQNIKDREPEKHILKGCHDPINLNVFINIKDHVSIEEIDQTILHELIHIKFPNLNHGIKFNSWIELYELKLKSKCDHIFSSGFQFGSITSSKGHEAQKYIRKKLDSFMCLKCYSQIVYNKKLIKNLIEIKNDNKPFSYFAKEYKLNNEVLLN